MRTRERKDRQLIQTVWDISRDGRSRIVTCSLRPVSDIVKGKLYDCLSHPFASLWIYNSPCIVKKMCEIYFLFTFQVVLPLYLLRKIKRMASSMHWRLVILTSLLWYSRTPLIRPPSESHWCGRIRGMVAREGFVYEQNPLSVTRNVVVWEGWSLVRVVVHQGFYCTGLFVTCVTYKVLEIGRCTRVTHLVCALCMYQTQMCTVYI